MNLDRRTARGEAGQDRCFDDDGLDDDRGTPRMTSTRAEPPHPASGDGPGTAIVRRPARPVQRRSPPPRSGAVGRTWWVAGNGDIEIVAGRRPRAVAVLAPAPSTPSVRRWGHSVGAGLAAAAAVVGLGLLVAVAEPPTPTVAAGAAQAPGGLPPVAPSVPAMDFVVPVLPAVPQVPAGFADPGYPVLSVPAPGPPAAVPVPLFTTRTDTAGATTAGAEGGRQTDLTQTRSAATTTPATPTTTTPSTLPTPPVRAQLPGPTGIETLVPAGPAGGEFPDVLAGTGLGLWSGGTGEPAVLVLGAEHAAKAALRAPGPPGGRWVVVQHGDGSDRLYLLGDPVVVPRAGAVDLLAASTAALVLVVSVDGGDVTLLEAR